MIILNRFFRNLSTIHLICSIIRASHAQISLTTPNLTPTLTSTFVSNVIQSMIDSNLTIRETRREFQKLRSYIKRLEMFIINAKINRISVAEKSNVIQKIAKHNESVGDLKLNLTEFLNKNFQVRRRNDRVYETFRNDASLSGEKLNDLKNPRIAGVQLTSDLFNLFTFLKFDHHECHAQNIVSGRHVGTCYSPDDCRTFGGRGLGKCALDLGVCCLVQLSCGQFTSLNRTYFTNADYPNASGATKSSVELDVDNLESLPVEKHGKKKKIKIRSKDRFKMDRSGDDSCSMKIYKSDPSIAQIRLDFEMFEMGPPTNGDCNEDVFIVRGQNANNYIPKLCGINTGQHMYIDVSQSPGPIELFVNAKNPHIFRVLVTQISDRLQPIKEHCLQQFNQEEGVIETFNYAKNGVVQVFNAAGYFNNLNYAICFDKLPGYCGITYEKSVDEVDDFQMTNVDEDDNLLFPSGQAGAEIFNCPDDYIVINGIRLCGERLNDGAVVPDFNRNAPISENTNGPLILNVRTNAKTVGRGFRLKFRLNKCDDSATDSFATTDSLVPR